MDTRRDLNRPIIVLAILLLATVVHQEPIPADVRLPEGWKGGFSSVRGPGGEEIVYAPYEPTGYLALTTHEVDEPALLVRAILDRRRVDVAVREDGYLVVSYPSGNAKPFYGLCFDYWTQTKTGRQAAKALAICLTRLDVLQREGERDKVSEGELSAGHGVATSDYPFDHMAVSLSFGYTVDAQSKRTYFKGRGGQTVERRPGSPPKNGKWDDQLSVLGRTIRWGEDAAGHGWATAGADVFVSSEAKPQGMVLAMLAAIAYKANIR